MTVVSDLIFTVSVIIALVCLMLRIEMQSSEIRRLKEDVNWLKRQIGFNSEPTIIIHKGKRDDV